MNWRQKFNTIIKDYGHDVYLQRRTTDIGVGNYGYRPNHGFSNTLEKHTARSRLGSNAGLSVVEQEQFEGVTHDVDKVFYFKWDVNPDKGDRIYENEPVSREIYTIDWAEPLRGKNGSVVYWAVGANMQVRD